MTHTLDEFYAEPDGALKRRRTIEYATQFIRPLFPTDRSVHIADLGAGYGLFLDACRKQGYEHIEGVETSEAFVLYARQELNIHTIVCGDLFSYLESKEDESLDVITAFNIIEHIKRDRVQSLLIMICQKLKQGGIFIMEVPNADSPLGIHTYFSDLTHEFAFSKKLALTVLRLAGFDDVKVRYQPNLRNPLIKLAQKILAKVIGLEYPSMFSGNIILVGYKK